MPSTVPLADSDCGVLNSKQNFESAKCNRRLPYICKKSINASSTETTGRLAAALASAWVTRLKDGKWTVFISHFSIPLQVTFIYSHTFTQRFYIKCFVYQSCISITLLSWQLGGIWVCCVEIFPSPSLQSLLYIKIQCVLSAGSRGTAGVTSWWRTSLETLQTPSNTVTKSREEKKASWPASTPLTAKRWSVLIFMLVNI